MGDVIATLEATIQDRKEKLPSGSYTVSLLNRGIPAIAQKVGEEGVEVALAAVLEEPERLSAEMADLVYHCLVLLAARELTWDDVETELRARFA